MKRYRQIVVHAGLSKTGTTSIQMACETHADFLLEQGVFYPQFHFSGEPLKTHSIPLTTALADRPGKYGLRLGQRFAGREQDVISGCQQQWQQVLAHPQADTLLLSTELVASFDAADMATLRASLAPHAERVRVIAYVRTPQSALESLLMERAKAGALVEPINLVGRVRQKIENLQDGFDDWLEVVSYHAAKAHPLGLVGSFLARVCVSESALANREFASMNERLSMEAFTLMYAINKRYSRQAQEEHGITRMPGDLDALGGIPGPKFQLQDFTASDVYEACLNEARWLEAHLHLTFPEVERSAPQPLWQEAALAALPEAAVQLSNASFTRCVAECLAEQARYFEASDPDTCKRLAEISRQLMDKSDH